MRHVSKKRCNLTIAMVPWVHRTRKMVQGTTCALMDVEPSTQSSETVQHCRSKTGSSMSKKCNDMRCRCRCEQQYEHIKCILLTQYKGERLLVVIRATVGSNSWWLRANTPQFPDTMAGSLFREIHILRTVFDLALVPSRPLMSIDGLTALLKKSLICCKQYQCKRTTKRDLLLL